MNASSVEEGYITWHISVGLPFTYTLCTGQPKNAFSQKVKTWSVDSPWWIDNHVLQIHVKPYQFYTEVPDGFRFCVACEA